MTSENDTIIRRQPALAEQVADFLILEIERGVYPAGEPLPAESELAKRLEVSRTVVREAMARLKHDGFLESRQGSRTKVVHDPMRRVFRLDHPEEDQKVWLRDLYELRAILESEALALAARRRTAGDLKEIKAKLVEFQKAVNQGGEGTAESLSFHKSMMEASHNPHLANFIDWVDAKIFSLQRLESGEIEPATVDKIHAEHRHLVEALEKSDPQEARKATLRHVKEAAARRGLNLDI